MYEFFNHGPDLNVGVGSEDSRTLLLGDAPLTAGAPVRLPPELGGGETSIVEAGTHGCPKGCAGGPHRALLLANGLIVVVCPAHGFLWCKPRAAEGSR